MTNNQIKVKPQQGLGWPKPQKKHHGFGGVQAGGRFLVSAGTDGRNREVGASMIALTARRVSRPEKAAHKQYYGPDHP
jgi:hypothetical protein